MSIEVVVLGIGGSFFVGMSWWGFCIELTYKQRQKMLHAIKPGDADFWEQMSIFETASFGQHLRALFLLKNPYKLYKIPYHVVAMREEA